ncbi:GmrSD restriction endonuclease domain-containing protein [Leucobacter sp. HY1910]
MIAVQRGTPGGAARTRVRPAAALFVALGLLLTGCGEAAPAVTDAPSASVVEEAPLAQNTTPEVKAPSSPPTDGDAAGAGSKTDTAPAAGSAAELLATLAVKGRSPKTGYDRKAMFGSPWFDADRNGCDTRNDILQRDLTGITLSGRCKVLSGTLADKYTGQTIDFVRGQDTSRAVQIDHVVALSDAWQKGAQQLSQDARVALANDPINLYAADGPANSAKGDSDAASWLPSNRAFRCEYVAKQVSVKAAYRLWVTAAERDAMQRVLQACPDEPAVESSLAAALEGKLLASQAPDPAPAEQPAPAPEPAPAPAPPVADTYFKNCTAAREAGAAPVYEGQPGYGRHLDRDGDGVGCE